MIFVCEKLKVKNWLIFFLCFLRLLLEAFFCPEKEGIMTVL